ncbi:MAG: sulfite exporter TauE/SafE family protein [Thermodesulfobacteriota bacterium]
MFISSTLAATLGLGFLLGLKHALDADHIVAVSALVSKYKSISKSSYIGLFWGIGHTVSLLVIGLIVIFFRFSIPPKLALLMEFGVAVMLVILGINILFRFFKDKKVHIHSHKHDDVTHSHFHIHDKEKKFHDHNHLLKFGSKPFFVGMVHGMAGSAAVMLLVLTTIPSPVEGVIYLIIFGIGSIAGMLIMSALISIPFVVTANKYVFMNEGIKITAGVSSVLFGIFLGFKILFGSSVFL